MSTSRVIAQSRHPLVDFLCVDTNGERWYQTSVGKTVNSRGVRPTFNSVKIYELREGVKITKEYVFKDMYLTPSEAARAVASI